MPIVYTDQTSKMHKQLSSESICFSQHWQLHDDGDTSYDADAVVHQ